MSGRNVAQIFRALLLRVAQVGATVAEHQPQDDVRVMRDPAGHVFCLFADEKLGPNGW